MAAAAWRAGVFVRAARRAGQRARRAGDAAVVRGDLSATTPVAATLGYAGSYTVTGQGGGTLTWLPRPGQVISQGQVLYQTGNGSPGGAAVRHRAGLAGHVGGTTGADVSQLNHDLVALGDASSADIAAPGWDYFSWETGAGVQQLEEHLGVTSPAGSLSLGQVVFEPRGDAGQPGDREPGRPGVRAGASGDLRSAGGDDRAGHRAAVGGQGRGHGER